jgi:hypothetical protein
MLNKFVIHPWVKIVNNVNNANHSIASLSMFLKMALSYLWGGEVGGGESKDAKYLAMASK